MSYGKDERDIDKHVWKLPIPLYDPADAVHQRLSELGRHEAQLVTALNLDERGNYVILRQHVRQALAVGSSAEEVTEIVTELLG
jgi:hypothetical protein